ncbi:uncharacterized protein [Diadema antillarum]|uniref:uncharacterized protein n=1 Tax=Diadema antillarum TaxID=105358 RepID=UPI003A8B6479
MLNRRRATPKFSCKECLHTDSTQEAIAVHYLQKHMDVDFCSLSTPVEDTSDEGMPQPSRGRKRKIATKTGESKSDSSSMETPEDSDELGRGKRKRRVPRRFITESELDKSDKTDKVYTSHARKKDKTEKKEESARVECREICSENKETGEKDRASTNGSLGSEQRVKIDTVTEESPANNDRDRHVVATAFQEAADEIHATVDKEQVSCDSISEIAEKHTESNQGHADKSLGTKKRKMTVKKGSSCTVSRRATKKKRRHHEVRKPRPAADIEDGKNGTELRTNELKCTSADCDEVDLAAKIARSETVNQKIKRLPVALEQFNHKVEKIMHEWRAVQKRRKEESIRTCSFPDCSLKMMEHELLLHETCHAKSMDGLRCPHCDFMCLHWRHMRKHLQKRHAKNTGRLYHCDQGVCKHTFDRSNQLRRHVLEKHIKEQLVNEILSGSIDLKEFKIGSEDTKGELNIDQTTQKSGCGTNNSEDTSSRPHRKRKQKRHKNDRAHREKSDDDHREKVTFICELCAAKFRDETSMLEHKESHITDQEGTFYCPECTIVCAGVEMLREHYHEEHKNKLMRYQCAECPFATNRFYQMSTHQAMHTGQKGVTCQQCGKVLANQYNLKVHKFRKHTTEEQKTVQCSACPYRCADKSVLRDHIKQHHKHMLKNPIYHRCPQCDYVGHKKQSLEFHMRVHTEQRRFKCNRCPYASKTKNHLKIHMQTHEGLQPASCQFCDFRAASKKRLSEHIMRRHLHIEPYLCKICQWRTAYSGNMWKHLNQHRKDLGTEMPEEPVIIDTDLLKGVVLPEMPKAPTGKMRGQSRTDSAEYTAVTLGQTLIEARHEVGLYELSGHQEVAPGSELQVVQISEETVGRPDAECDGGVPGDSHLQLVEIHDDAIGVNTIGQQVVAQLQDTNSQLSSALGDGLHEKLGHMEIFISHDAVGKTGESDKVVEVLHVREDGSIVSSTMNPDVEVAVLALAQLEPGTHTTELPSGVGDGSRITIVQTVQQDQQDAHCVHDAAVSAAIEAGIHTPAAKDNDDDALGQMSDETVQPPVSIQTHSDDIAQDVVELASQNGHSSADIAGHCSDMKDGGKSDGHDMTALENKMSDFQDGELQFRCKLCQFTGSSKAEIAEHFLNEHTEVEVVSPNKSATPPAASAPTDEKEDGEKEAHELQTKEKPPPKKRGRPRGKSNASYQKLSIQVPKSSPAAEDGTEALGRGMRKRKAKVPFNMTPFDDEKLEELSEEEKSSDGHKEKERLSDEEASGSSDEEGEEIEDKRVAEKL